MPVMSEEQFSHLEAMIKAVVDAHIAAYNANAHEKFNANGATHHALQLSDLEHTVRKAAKEALTK